MTYSKRPPETDAFSNTSEKLMQTFRMSRDLVSFLKGEANARGSDLTAYVTRVLEGLRNFYGLPAPAAHILEEDRKALGVDRADYLHHLLYERSIAVREKGPGFDSPRKKR
jgi:hypothetical protein